MQQFLNVQLVVLDTVAEPLVYMSISYSIIVCSLARFTATTGVSVFHLWLVNHHNFHNAYFL